MVEIMSLHFARKNLRRYFRAKTDQLFLPKRYTKKKCLASRVERGTFFGINRDLVLQHGEGIQLPLCSSRLVLYMARIPYSNVRESS